MSHRVAIVAHHALGGSGVMAVEWARLLARRGHDVHLLRTGTSVRDAAFTRDAERRTPRVHTVTAPGHPVLDGPSEVAAMVGALAALHAKAALDIVHVHYALPFAHVVPVIASASNRPGCVVSLHGSDVTGVGADPAYAPGLALSLACCDAITTPSAWLGSEARTRGLVGDARVDILPNFIALDHFVPRPLGAERELVRAAFGSDHGAPVIVHLSNFRAVKRVADVVASVQRLRETTPVRLVLVGDGPERARLESEARAALGEHVTLVGAVADPAAWLREADALLLPSETESFGLVALEALASGTPVVASNAGGLPDWLGASSAARLCPVGDIDAFARGLADVLHPPDRPRLAAAARASAELAGAPETAALALEDLYRRVLSARRSP